jgi:prepilin-type N-terminal cleavage/methylation domain-containing protein
VHGGGAVLSRRAGDDGFTLVELLISVTVLGIVMSAVAGVMTVTITSAATANTRLTESNDLRRAATYFAADVQGATSVAVATTPRCGTGAAEVVVEFLGQDFADAGPAITTTVVSYVLRPVTDSDGTRQELHRLTCTAATATPTYPLTAPTTDVVVVRRVSTVVPVPSCVPSSCAGFTQVNLVVRETSGALVYTLTGRRRSL